MGNPSLSRVEVLKGAWASLKGRKAEEPEGYEIALSLAGGYVLWYADVLAWWQALTLAAGLIVALCIIGMKYSTKVVLVFVMIAAPLLLVFGQLLIFWVVSGPDTTVTVTITSKYEEHTPVIGTGSPPVDAYFVRAVDDQGYRWEMAIALEQWKSLSEGDKTSITYHDEAFAGRWLSRCVVTRLGNDSPVSGGGRFGTGMETMGSLLVIVASAVPFALLVWVWVRLIRQEERRLLKRLRSHLRKIDTDTVRC